MPRRFALRLSTVAVLATTLTILPAARADFLSEFYSDAGAAMNYTAGGAYQTQAGNAYVGPSISIRVPPKNLHPFAVTAPSVRASCSGIDMIAGSLGFVNETQLVNFIRNIGQAAPAYFFQLAMRSVAPEIAATLDVLNDLAQKMNQFGMNSCQALNTAFGTVFDKTDADTAQRAANWKVQMGEAADHFTGIFGVKPSFRERYETEQRRLNTNQSGMKNAAGVPVDPQAVWNLVWNSLQQMDGIDFTSTSDQQYTRLMMSLTGTLVSQYDPTAAPDAGPVIRWVPPTLTNLDQLLGDPTATTTLDLLQCNLGPACDAPTRAPETIPRGFLRLVREDLTVMRDAIISKNITNQTAYDNALALLGMTPIPVYRIIAASTRGSFSALSDTMLNHIAEAVAIDIAATYVLRAMADLEKALATGRPQQSGVKPEQVAKIEEVIKIRRQQVTAKSEMARNAASAVGAYIQQVEHLERSFYANASTQLAANLRFGAR